MEKEDRDEVTQAMGSWGRWQIIILVIIGWTGIWNAWHMMVIVFYAPNADHWCSKPPDSVYQNWTVERWKNYSIPPDDKESSGFSRCEMYDRNYSMLPDTLESPHNLSTIDCQYGWDFDRSFFHNTIESEWTLVCDREVLAKTGASAYYAGIMTGVFVTGLISDWIGRKNCLLLTTLTSLIAGVITAFMPYLELFYVTRFFIAMGCIGGYTASFVLTVEIFDGKWRSIMTTVKGLPWTIGYISLSFFGYFIRDWRKMQLSLSVPIVLLLLLWPFISESPRWLISKGRNEEAYKILIKAAKTNKREHPHKILQQHKEKEEIDKKGTLFDLFRRPILRYRTLILFFNWFVVAFVYFGISAGSIGNLGGNIFTNFVIAGAVEIPGFFLCLWVLVKIGRRVPHAVFLVICGIVCVATYGFKKGQYSYDWPIVSLAMLGKLFIGCGFGIMYIFSAELFPTVVRNTGVGACSMFARFGAISAPYVDLTRHWHPSVPFIIYGVFAVAAGLLTLFLPDTTNLTLPETMEDAENLGRKKVDVSSNKLSKEAEEKL